MAFRHLLVPTDFSEPANYALRYAMEEAASTTPRSRFSMCSHPTRVRKSSTSAVCLRQDSGAALISLPVVGWARLRRRNRWLCVVISVRKR